MQTSTQKNIKYSEDMALKTVWLEKKDSLKLRSLGISNLEDRAIQLQFLVLLDPLVESLLPDISMLIVKRSVTSCSFSFKKHWG
jgi:retron-type reverse transcriptase